jgi:hypothetical protein
MKRGTRKGGPIYPAPHSKTTVWVFREIFSEDDIPSIELVVRLPLVVETPRGKRRAPKKDLAKALNEAAGNYFKYVRDDEREDRPSEFVKWSDRVSRAGADLLRALGIDPAKPAPMSWAALVALCMRPKQLTARNHGVKNHDFALGQVAGAAAYIHDLGKQAARYHVSRTVPVRDRAKRVPARQKFLLLLAQAYEKSFGKKVPKVVNSVDAPFLRFALWVCATLAERMTKMADQPTTPQGHRISRYWRFDLPDEVWEQIAPHLDTSNAIDEGLVDDCAAAAELGTLAGTQIADDMRKRVYARLRARRPVRSPLVRK